eukprot:TRINITY_DN5548_c1_g1_i2.p1 TRINITY_DN5548_c1_g1~~TRINITY_DN5548_c1_g1_i2.p1  ORF type:complete len:170 (-),score=46.07 TRINITY_DN5548_c1_g1_i2:106-576(-)
MKGLIFLCFFACAFSHLILLAPHQRGNITCENTVACPDGFVTTGPCGSAPPKEPGIEIRPAIPFYVTFQKNLNHWYAANPGNFTISYSKSNNPVSQADFHVIGTIPDTNSSSLTLYIQQVRLPISSGHENHGTLQVIYYTGQAGLNFYQCADVAVL